MTDKSITEFWETYKKGDYFQRREALKLLPFFKDLPEMLKANNISPELLTYLFISTCQGYIDDIIEDYRQKEKETQQRQRGNMNNNIRNLMKSRKEYALLQNALISNLR